MRSPTGAERGHRVALWGLSSGACCPDGRARAAAVYSFDIPAGQRIGVIGVEAAGAHPDLLLTGPGHRRVQVSTDGMHIDGGAFVMRQPSTGQVLIEIPHPPSGRWTLQDAPGAPPLKVVELAHTMPTPSIRVSVTGSGTRRALHYRVASRAGLGVSFVETVGKGAAPIGSAHGAQGTIRFTPAVGSAARRTIIARITPNGLAAPSIVVGRYLPGRVRPGTATRLGVRHRGRAWAGTDARPCRRPRRERHAASAVASTDVRWGRCDEWVAERLVM